MYRVAVFGKWKPTTRKVPQFVRAFRDQGNETLWLDPGKIKKKKGEKADEYTLEQLKSFRPDIVFVYNQFISVPVLEEIAGTGIKTVLFWVDWTPEIPSSLIERGRLVDLFLMTSRGLVEEYRQAGIRNPVYIADSCDRYDHRRRRPILGLWKSDVAFIGAARPNEPRIPLIKRLDEICKVRVYGRYWRRYGIWPMLRSVGPYGYSLICGGAKIILGSDIVSTVEGYWSNRLWITLGCGGFLLTNYVPGMEEIFTNREHLVWYHDEEECVALVREYLHKPDERERIAEQGYRLVHEHHTFHHFAGKVIELCRELPGGNANNSGCEG
jgi:spore maturation protein CgeB